MSSVADRLSSCKSDAEADQYLSGIWKSFAGSEQHQALEIAIKNLIRLHEPVLHNINTTSDQRSFACGHASAAKTLAAIIQTAIDYVPPTDPENIKDAQFEVLDGGRDPDEQKFDDSLSDDSNTL